jgi:hypothetical protein
MVCKRESRRQRSLQRQTRRRKAKAARGRNDNQLFKRLSAFANYPKEVIAQAFDELDQAGCLDELKEVFDGFDTARFLHDIDQLGLRNKLENAGLLDGLVKAGLLENVESIEPLGKGT